MSETRVQLRANDMSPKFAASLIKGLRAKLVQLTDPSTDRLAVYDQLKSDIAHLDCGFCLGEFLRSDMRSLIQEILREPPQDAEFEQVLHQMFRRLVLIATDLSHRPVSLTFQELPSSCRSLLRHNAQLVDGLSSSNSE